MVLTTIASLALPGFYLAVQAQAPGADTPTASAPVESTTTTPTPVAGETNVVTTGAPTTSISATGTSVATVSAAGTSTAGIGITSPVGGSALQGQIAITGTSELLNFTSMEVDFAYTQSPGPNWFPLIESQAPIKSGLLANWDTTTITDGTYNLRLVVTVKDGTQKTVEVDGLRVRNYSPVETSTPTITSTLAPLHLTPTYTPTMAPTRARPQPSPLPTNPAGIHPVEIDLSLLRGAGVAFLLFAALGLYLLIRAWLMRR